MKLSKAFKQAGWGLVYLIMAVGIVAFFIMRFCVMVIRSLVLWFITAPRVAYRGFKLFRAIMREKKKYKTACAAQSTEVFNDHVKR
jgi:multisubunit Na+/H+ antiporter MnhG subunit